jgi:hypothetical protein
MDVSALFTVVDVTVLPNAPIEAALFRLSHCTHEQRFNSACVHTRGVRSYRGRSLSEPEGNESVSCTLKVSNRPARDAGLTSADCRSEDGTPSYPTAEHHPGKECRVYSLEVAKVSGPRALSGTCTKRGFLHARLVLDEERQAIRNRCLTLLEEEDDVVRYVASIQLVDW